MSFNLFERLLSDAESYIVCDADSIILHTGQGFTRMFGFSKEECYGKPCGELVARRFNYAMLSDKSGLPVADVQTAIQNIQQQTRGAVRRLTDSQYQADFGLAVNVTKGGQHLTIQIVVVTHKHPHFGRCFVGLQRDVSHLCPPGCLVQLAHEPGMYNSLLAFWPQGPGSNIDLQIRAMTEQKDIVKFLLAKFGKKSSEAFLASKSGETSLQVSRPPSLRHVFFALLNR